jgi:hypothetical protein
LWLAACTNKSHPATRHQSLRRNVFLVGVVSVVAHVGCHFSGESPRSGRSACASSRPA